MNRQNCFTYTSISPEQVCWERVHREQVSREHLCREKVSKKQASSESCVKGTSLQVTNLREPSGLGAGIRDKAGREEACKEQICGNQMFRDQLSDIKRARNKRIFRSRKRVTRGDANPALTFGRPHLERKYRT
jgi:hypothetical protein